MGSEDYYKKWFDDMKKWFDDSRRGMNFNAALFDQFNKQIEQYNSQTKNSWEHPLKIVQTSYVNSTQRTIETNAQAGPAFKTIIGLDGDLKKEFSTPPPEANNAYGVSHNRLVDEALATQNEIIRKVIGTIGATIQKFH